MDLISLDQLDEWKKYFTFCIPAQFIKVELNHALNKYVKRH